MACLIACLNLVILKKVCSMSVKKLRVLHTAVSMNPSSGVIRQMESEQESAQELGISWDVSLHTAKNVSSKVVSRGQRLSSIPVFAYFKLRWNFYKWLRSVEKNYDLIILRHSVHDPMEALFSRDFGNKLLTVHHTLEIAELRGVGGLKGQIKALLEKWVGGYTLRKSRGTIGVTSEILLHERSRLSPKSDKLEFRYPNGIHCSDRRALDARGQVPDLIFVAAYFASWHGLDLLIDSAEKNTAACRIHIVGLVPEELRLRCERDERFVLHGVLDATEISSLMERAWCGLSSFALFRKSMQEACTLKVREYLDAGIPVYSGHRDVFPEDFIFFKNGEASLESILQYAGLMRSASRAEVFEAAKGYIDKKSILRLLEVELRGAHLFKKS